MSKKKCPSGNCNCLAPFKTNAPCNDHTNFTCFRLKRFKDINGRGVYKNFPPTQSRFYKDFEKTGKVEEECLPEEIHTKKPTHKKNEGAAHAMHDGAIPVIDMDSYIQY